MPLCGLFFALLCAVCLLAVPPLLASTPAAPLPDLYVSSAPAGSVLRLNGVTGTLASSFSAGSLASGVAFGPDGALYAASYGSGTVVRIDPVTGQTKPFAVPGHDDLHNPLGVTFGPDGNLYVVANGGVLRFNGKTGAAIDTFVPYASGGLGNPYDLRFGPDGNLYVTSGGSSNVLRYDGATGAFLGAFVPSGSGGLSLPTTLTFGPDGDLYVAGQSGVLRYKGNTGAFVGVAVAPVTGLFGLAFAPDGTLYVTSTANPSGLSNSSILHFNPATKEFLGVFASLNSDADFLAFAPPAPASPAAQELIVNGGFETNGLSGWTVTDEPGSMGSYYAASGTSLSGIPYIVPNSAGPASGTGYALSVEGGPSASALTQTFTVPPGGGKVTLSYDLFVNDYSSNGPVLGPQGLDFSFEKGPNQQARVDLLTATALPLSTAPADVLRNFYDSVDSHALPNPHGYTHYTFDITDLTGKGGTYTLRFAQVENQAPLLQGIDNVGVRVTPAFLPPAPFTLTILPTAVISGAGAASTLTLNSPAMPGPDPSGQGLGQYGAVVRLGADAPLHVDGSTDGSSYVFRGGDGTTYVLIPTGRTTAQLRLLTAAVPAPTNAALKATYSGSTVAATVTINPIQVASLTFSPAVVTGGGQATATLTLNAPATPSPDPTQPGQTAPGIVFRLDATSPASLLTGSLPSGGYLFQTLNGQYYLFVPQGQTTVNFTVLTLPVGTQTAATLTATLNGASQSAALTVQPGVPSVTALNPSSAVAGGPAFSLSVSGRGFTPNAVVSWNNKTRTTHYVSPTQLTADIPASDLAAVGTAQVIVATSIGVSASVPFTIGIPRLTVTAKISRDATMGQIVAAVTVANTGTAPAAAARLTAATLGTGKALSLPMLGTIDPGQIVTTEVRFLPTVGNAGTASVLRLSGVYVTGSFQSSQRVTLP